MAWRRSGAAVFNNQVSADPFPSPEENSITAILSTSPLYVAAGTYTVKVTVMDDDGGRVSQNYGPVIG